MRPSNYLILWILATTIGIIVCYFVGYDMRLLIIINSIFGSSWAIVKQMEICCDKKTDSKKSI